MFFNCKKFDCDLNNWDVSNVENMHSMFTNCISFEGKGLDKWDVVTGDIIWNAASLHVYERHFKYLE